MKRREGVKRLGRLLRMGEREKVKVVAVVCTKMKMRGKKKFFFGRSEEQADFIHLEKAKTFEWSIIEDRVLYRIV